MRLNSLNAISPIDGRYNEKTKAFMGKPVPGTDELAIVTTIDAIADHGTKLFRDRSLQFNCQVGNAASCIHFIGTNDCLCWTNINTGRASSAVVFGEGIIAW